MNIQIEKELAQYLFPVREEKIYYPSEGNLKSTDDFKSIVRTDTGQIISVMKDTYKLIPNRVIIESLLNELESIDCKFVLDKIHSYVDNSQMRLSVSLPQYFLTDHESKIFLGLQVINSYSGNYSYSRKIFFRKQICNNGLLVNTLFDAKSRKHTSGFEIDELKNDIENSVKKFPILQMKIDELSNTKVTKKFRDKVRAKLGKTVSEYLHSVEKRGKDNLYDVYHHLTYWASHICNSKLQMQYHSDISKLFEM